MVKTNRKGLIPILLQKDTDGCFGFERADTRQIVDRMDLKVLTEPPISLNLINYQTSSEGKIHLNTSYEIPLDANAILFGIGPSKNSHLERPASYCILTEKPDDGIRRIG